MNIIKAAFNIGDLIYLKMDAEQKQRIVTGILVRPTGVTYDCSAGASSSWHYELEMTVEKNVLATTTN